MEEGGSSMVRRRVWKRDYEIKELGQPVLPLSSVLMEAGLMVKAKRADCLTRTGWIPDGFLTKCA